MAITTLTLEELPAAVGRTLGTSDWIGVDAEQVARFRRATGTPGADGSVPPFLVLSLTNRVLPAVVDVQGASSGLNYGTGEVRFPSPLAIGSRLRGSVAVERVDDVPGGVQVVLRITVAGEDGATVCVVDAMGRYLR